MAKPTPAQLAADYFALRARACELVASYEQSRHRPPARLLRFAGIGPRTPKPEGPKGSRPAVLPALLRWFAARGNEPATYRQAAEGAGLKLAQVRTCCSRNSSEHFERAGDEQVGDRLYAKVRLSAVGLAAAEGLK